VGLNASKADTDRKAHELGLDRPLPARYWTWVSHAARGDLGTSWFTSLPVRSMLVTKMPVTLSIVGVALLWSAIASVVLGIAAARYRGWLDRLVQVSVVVGFAIPSFVVALVLVTFLAVRFRVFPATGYTAPGTSPRDWLVGVTLPAVSLAIGATAATAQQVRSALIEVLNQDFVRTLRSRGLPEHSILYKHALRNAASPALTVLSLQFIGLLSGAIVIEKVFALQGIGSMLLTAGVQGDIPAVLGVVVASVAVVVVVNLLIDLANAWLNPKVRTR
jgi:peptide/nickel transport system permease protein